MPKNVDLELDDFIRWLATMPHHFAEFRKDPENVMRYAKLSDGAKQTLRGMGPEAAKQLVQDKLDEILSPKEAGKQPSFARDMDAPGFGGTVISKEPKDE